MLEGEEPVVKIVRVGLVGSGFMGRSHAHALRAAAGIFELPAAPVLELLADVDDEIAARAAKALGFSRSTGDWKALVEDPDIDLVDITAPNKLHKPIALAAIAAGKPVYCEKPLAPNAAEALEMAEAAEKAGVLTAVGFNYLKNPMVALSREIIAAGEIGEVVSFRGIHAEDYMTDPAAPWTWRLDPYRRPRRHRRPRQPYHLDREASRRSDRIPRRPDGHRHQRTPGFRRFQRDAQGRGR